MGEAEAGLEEEGGGPALLCEYCTLQGDGEGPAAERRGSGGGSGDRGDAVEGGGASPSQLRTDDSGS